MQLRSGQRTPAQGKEIKNHQPSPHATKGSKHAAAEHEHAAAKSFTSSRLTSGT